jgi:pimeloyl-ACP methyl ester carboxylesterase
MQREATETLPALLDTIGFRRGLLLGHSDGASIAAYYVGSHQDHRVRGVLLMAPHFFVETEGLAEIANAKKAYETTDLRAKLARHHANVDVAFRGWNDAWLDPKFATAFDITDALAYIRVPVLVIQGADDRYGTLAQVRIVEDECYCPVETLVLPGCGHAPHREKSQETLDTITAFSDRIFRAHGESIENAA